MVFKAVRRHKQAAVFAAQVGDGHVLEKIRRVLADAGVGGHQAEVRVEPGGLFIVVSGADLRDILYPATFPAGYEAYLGVHLIVFEAVEDGAAGLLKTLGPGDIVLLVEAGAQLHEHSDILAVLRSGGQVFYQLGRLCQAVDSYLDGENGGVGRRLLHKLEEGFHRLIGIEQQRVVAQDLRYELFSAYKVSAPLWDIRLVTERGGALRRQAALKGIHIAHGQRAFACEHLLPAELQAAAEVLHDLIRGFALYLQPHMG